MIRGMKRNKRPFWYAMLTGYEIVRENGDPNGYEIGRKATYSDPIKAWANISAGGGEIGSSRVGILTDYNKVLNTVDLDEAVASHIVRNNLYTGESLAHTFSVVMTKNGESVDITRMSVSGNFVKSNKQTVAISGSIENNKAVVTLPADCYTHSGPFGLFVLVQSGDSTFRQVVLYVTGNVVRSATDDIIIPTASYDDINALYAKIKAEAARVPIDISDTLYAIQQDINTVKDKDTAMERNIVKNSDDIVALTGRVEEIESGGATVTNHWSGAKISIVGDSISSFAGHVPSGNRAYYSSTSKGLNRYADMWFNVMANELGAEILVVDAWSGSSVTPGKGSQETDVAGCSDLRTSRLAANGTNPDAILIALGVNDYIGNTPVGSWDALVNIPETPETFAEAYVGMVRKIRENYPGAAIVAITPWFVKRGVGNRSGVYRNGINLTEGAYAKAIHDMSELMGFEVIDGLDMGFHKWNYAPNFCEDTVSETHPNAAGHRVMGLAVANKMKSMYAGFIGTSGTAATSLNLDTEEDE